MTTWILIWFIHGGYGVTSGSQEFNTQAACIAAQDEVKKLSSAAKTICVKRGDQ